MSGQLDRLQQARDWYLRAVDALSEDGWRKPSLCAGWTAAHVVAHVATGDQLTRAMVLDALGRDRAGEDLPVDFADRRRRMEAMSVWEPRQLAEAAHTASEQSVAAVAEALGQPAAIVHMPFGDVPPRVVTALRLNEYVIHGHDLAPALGRALPVPDWFIPTALPDSVNLLMRLHQRSPHKGKAASFHLHRTDGEGEWILRAQDGQAVAESGHGKADVALRGPGDGLYWVMMGRGTPQEHGVEVLGDQALAAVFKEYFPGP
jgi:uncharacterized protein (TIGR03083 family)